MWKKILFAFLSVFIGCFGLLAWLYSLIETNDSQTLKETKPESLLYLQSKIKEHRGKILAVVTSTNKMGTSDKRTGYELTELARAYYVFSVNGFEVDIASPNGGLPPVIIDNDDMGAYDYAFLNDPIAQSKANNTIPLKAVSPNQYQAVYFVGGKGAMYDFPENPMVQKIVRDYFQSQKVIGAVCHGPAALVNVTLDDGSKVVANKTISGFTNEEELFLIPDAKQIFPFLLEDKLISQGANFNAGLSYLNQVSQDGYLITGQNPWSVWSLAETMINRLGYMPVPRDKTGEENSVDILQTYETQGFNQAYAKLNAILVHQNKPIKRNLIAMHSIVAAMQMELVKAADLVRLVSAAKSMSERKS